MITNTYFILEVCGIKLMALEVVVSVALEDDWKLTTRPLKHPLRAGAFSAS